MSQDFFSVVAGLEIESDDLSSSIQLLQGDGSPGTRVVEQDAPIGSAYYQNDAAPNSLNVWWKYRDLNNDVTDWQVSASKEYVDGPIFTGSAPALTTTILDDTLLTSEATEAKWMLQIKDAGVKREAFEIHALTDEIAVSFTTYAKVKLNGKIGKHGFDVTVGNSPTSWIVSLTPDASAGDLTYTLQRIAFSFLA